MIRVDYEQSRAAARKLHTASSECGQLINKANQLNATIPNYWEGLSAQAFLSEIMGWIQETRLIQSELSKIADDIIRVTNEFETVDKQLASQSRNSGSKDAFGGGGGSR